MEYSQPLRSIIENLKVTAISGSDCSPISGITHDSRAIKPGMLFVCLKGEKHDGHKFALQAVEQGAAALLVSKNGLESANVQLPPGVSVITVPDTRKALPLAACAFYKNPSHQLKMIGVTGTNGKTTSALMIAAILRAAGQKVGVIGTLGAELDGIRYPSEHTTPEADQLQSLLADMHNDGADSVVMEVSSHSIDQERTAGIAFNAVVFTNITQDHLDYHKTMDAYFDTKARLFSEYPVKYPRSDGRAFLSVINVVQWEGRELVTLARGEIVTFSTTDTPGVLTVRDVSLSAESSHFTLIYDDGTKRFERQIDLSIGGSFQVSNALGAAACCLRLGKSIDDVAAGLASLKSVPGRFEAVRSEKLDFSVVVDYAHTPDGLDNLLKSARSLNPKRLITVFGCGGNRDRAKRPIMGRLAAEQSDVAIVTSDNPRHENRDDIISDILAGMDFESNSSLIAKTHILPDRREAIEFAIRTAQSGDIVLIAGKGHEDYQIVGEEVLPFDDRVVAGEILKQLASEAA